MTDKPSQLPNCIREALLGLDAYRTAIMLDLLLTLGYKEGQWVTFKECIDVCSQYTAQHIIREGLKHYTIKRKKLPTTHPGRPTFAYKIPKIDHLKYKYVVEWSTASDTLQLADFRNGKSYRMALHRELIHRANDDSGGNGASFSRKFLTDRLNVCADTVRRYEKELGIYVEARWQTKQIKDKYDIIDLPTVREHNGKYIEVSSRRGKLVRLPALKAVAGMYLKQGYEVWLKSRLTNLYHPENPFVSSAQMEENNTMLANLFGSTGE